MQEHDAVTWFLLARMLDEMQATCRKYAPNAEFVVTQALIDNFESIQNDCVQLNLGVSAEVIKRSKGSLESWLKTKSGWLKNYHDVDRALETIGETISAELESIVFLRLADDRAKFYREKLLFGAAVDAIFPSAITDIEEAGKCLALNRGTATVFHAMRVTEVGLKVLAGGLGIPYAPSWESYITQIEAKIGEKHARKTLSWKRSESFYRDVLGDLQAVKIAWRNPTMHIVRHYTPDEAEDVFRATRGFMRRLAEQNLTDTERRATAKAKRSRS